jgi:hypothetical protein
LGQNDDTGIYVSEWTGSNILGYRGNNKQDRRPACTVQGGENIGALGTDGGGNLIAASQYVGRQSLMIFQGPGMCGQKVATIAYPFGDAGGVATNDALGGTIAVANGNVLYYAYPSGIAKCTVKNGCTTLLTNPGIFWADSVAMDSAGDCWADGMNRSGDTTLTYFAKCKGGGVAATGFLNKSPGALDMDGDGNLVSLDGVHVIVYAGCNPSCTLLGRHALHCCATTGRLNEKSTAIATINYVTNQVDVYRYSATAITYSYSFSNGLSPSLEPIGIAYNSRSR